MTKPTQEQVLQWAREAGMRVGARRLFTAQDKDLLRLAALAYEAGRKDENEACAALCDKISDEDGFEGSYADRCAFAIRERGAP